MGGEKRRVFRIRRRGERIGVGLGVKRVKGYVGMAGWFRSVLDLSPLLSLSLSPIKKIRTLRHFRSKIGKGGRGRSISSVSVSPPPKR